MKIIYFPSAIALREWFAAHHAKEAELWVGYYKKHTGTPSVTWPESVDEALCVGWIDGIRKSVDANCYTIRFTPRKAVSTWSVINIKRVEVLFSEGRIQAAGLKAFQARRENKSGIYSYEQRRAELEEPYAGLLRKHKAACAFFHAQPPGYRKMVSSWIVSAKLEATRLKRLEKLIEASSRGQRV
jgi:uncharacterized protein YdeI (YjbR/CyaY-like superfamily)